MTIQQELSIKVAIIMVVGVIIKIIILLMIIDMTKTYKNLF